MNRQDEGEQPTPARDSGPDGMSADDLRRQVAKLTEELGIYKKLYLIEYAKNAPPITQAELDAATPLQPWLDVMLREVEAE